MDNSHRRFKTEFQVIRVFSKTSKAKTYQCTAKVDNHDYLCYKLKFLNKEDIKHYMQILKIFSKIYHRNVLRYYNSWLQTPVKPENNTAINYFIQTESAENNLKQYMENHFLTTQDEIKINIFQQIIDGVWELAHASLKQKGLSDLSGIFICQNNQIKIGDLENIELISQMDSETARSIFKEIENMTRSFFFDTYNKNISFIEKKKKMDQFFKDKMLQINVFNDLFKVLSETKNFIKHMNPKKEDIILTPMICKKENSLEWIEKLFSIVDQELRLYRQKTDKKAEQIFDLKSFDIAIDEKNDACISIKNPLLIGCLIKGQNHNETNQIFEKLISIRSG